MEISSLTVLTIVFVLACFIGYYVIWGVTPALHTPLMSVTNAISGIVLLGAIVVAGAHVPETNTWREAVIERVEALRESDPARYAAFTRTESYRSLRREMAEAEQNARTSPPMTAKVLGFFAVVLASINVFGGFAVTQRMLGMFKQKKKPVQAGEASK